MSYETQTENYTCAPVALRNLFVWLECKSCLKNWTLPKLIKLTKANKQTGVTEKSMDEALWALAEDVRLVGKATARSPIVEHSLSWFQNTLYKDSFAVILYFQPRRQPTAHFVFVESYDEIEQQFRMININGTLENKDDEWVSAQELETCFMSEQIRGGEFLPTWWVFYKP
jgi:hypothetical protein